MNESIEKQLIEKAAAKGIPVSVSLELLPLCNMNCNMCYVRLSKQEMEARGSLLSAGQWLDIGRQLQEAGVLFLIITGGEALLYSGFKEVYLGLLKLGMVISINTNGTLINEEWADFFRAHPPRRINITLYGGSSDVYERLCHFREGFDRAVNAIRLLRERNLPVKINGSIVRENVSDMKKLMDIAREYDTAINLDSYMYPAVRERERPFDQQARLLPEAAARAKVDFWRLNLDAGEVRNMAEEYMKTVDSAEEETAEPMHMRCQAGKSSFSVNWQGNMRPCVVLSEPSYPILELGVKKCWEMLREELSRITFSSECSGCRYRDICGICASCALYETGSFGGVPKYMCAYTQTIYEELKKELAKELG